VRVFFGVFLDGLRRAAVGVALAEDGVHGGAEELFRSAPSRPSRVGGGILGKIGELVALGLQLGDGGLELRDGGGDVGELDDVGLGLERERAELGESIGDALRGREQIGKLARMRPATEMSRVSIAMPACFVNACTIGSSE